MDCKDLKTFAQWSKEKLKDNYNFFMRLIIIRFMEVNLYIKPEVETFMKEFNDSQKFKNIFIKQWNIISDLIPEIFSEVTLEEIDNFPFKINNRDNDVAYYFYSNIQDLYFNVSKGASVDVIGWIYQYYNLENKESTSLISKDKKKISKDKIPSMTQIFTPDWIAKYLVQGSLGKACSENTVNLHELKCIDPCMGCGHILTALFDYLMQIYLDTGYSKEAAANSIIKNNLYGLDIDSKVYEIAYLSLIMKAMEYNPLILSTNIRPNVYCILESNNLDCTCLQYFGHNLGSNIRNTALKSIDAIINKFSHAMEYGSLITIDKFDSELINKFLYDTCDEYIYDPCVKISINKFIESFSEILKVAKLLSEKYNVVITNPPYLSKRVYNEKLSKFLNKNYPIAKFDLYSAFIYNCIDNLCADNGYVAMITIHSWMFISSFLNLRIHIINNYYISSMIHLGAGAFADVNAFNVLTTAFCIKKCENKHNSTFIKLTDFVDVKDKVDNLNNPEFQYNINQNSFKSIEGWPLVYWITDTERDIFKTTSSIKKSVIIKQGMATCDNKQFLRYWYEVPFDEIGFNIKSLKEASNCGYKWFPYNKGGNFRKWYGNNELVVNWENSGEELKQYTSTLKQGTSVRIKSQEYYFKEGITWSLFGFENFGVRYKEDGYIFDISGSSMFPEKKYIYYLLSFLSSSVAFKFLTYLAPTVNYQIKNIGDLPLIIDESYLTLIDTLALECIDICKEEWDEYELSWNFKRHPLLQFAYGDMKSSMSSNIILSQLYTKWEEYTINRFNRLKSNEEQLNKIFIDIYKLNNVVSYKVVDRDISVKKASMQKTIRSLISYMVGCAEGRYSLYYGKLIYIKNPPIFICQEDLCDKVLHLIKRNFGDKHFQNNIDFIAKGLYYDTKSKYNKLEAIEVIKKYFTYEFMKDHIKTYKKHPIYIFK